MAHGKVSASLSSKNFKRVIKKRYQRASKLKLDVYIGCKRLIGTCQGVVLSADRISELNEEAHEPIDASRYKRAFSSGFPVLYFEDRVMGTKMIVDYVTDLFRTSIDELYVDRNGIWAIDFINSRQNTPLAGLFLVTAKKEDPIADEEAEYVLRYSKTGELLDIHVKVSENFRFTAWFDPELEIVETDEVRRYRYRYDYLSYCVSCFLCLFSDGSEMEVQGGFSIQRMDGVNATIVCDIRLFCMVFWHSDGN
ncbi:Protein CBG21252 [Caenorhabditis briggsae]|uniref:Protein CBG21252 n=1 Tax=Caenorhabditis briggsae TaxID=6238 RepID=A8XZP5_CAEBR|nr:Protein CBG21252 [Caenorhabditis briggsae]CAP38112.2 Protein CBG21252 [Caenorhabditis briggsae]